MNSGHISLVIISDTITIISNGIYLTASIYYVTRSKSI